MMNRETELCSGKYEWELDYISHEVPIGHSIKLMFVIFCLLYASMVMLGSYVLIVEHTTRAFQYGLGSMFFILGNFLITVFLFRQGVACGVISFWIPLLGYLFAIKDISFFKYPLIMQLAGGLLMLSS